MVPRTARLGPLPLVIAALLLSACGATPAPVVIRETSVVIETVVVEKKGETVIQEVTAIVEVEKKVEVEVPVEKVVTATPEPEPTAPPKMDLDGLWYPSGDPLTLDPQLVDEYASMLIVHQCIEGLFEYRGDGSVAPSAATGYAVSDDGLVYTVTLRDGAVWSDGVPVVAQHYVDGVQRLLHPDTAAGYAWMMYPVKGAEAYNTGQVQDPSSLGIRAIDDHTLEVTLVEPTAYFEMVLPFQPAFSPTRLDLIEKYGDHWTEPDNLVCNGAYLIESWDHEVEIVLVKNPTYHSADEVRIEKVTLPSNLDVSTSLALYETGALHAASFPAEELPRILDDPVLSQELVRLPTPGVYYIGLNTQRPPTDNANVRKALAAAIDRQTILDNVVMRPWRARMTCTTPQNILGYQEPGTCGHDFNPEQARQYLADAGYPGGEGFPPLVFWFNRADYHEDVIEAAVAMWEMHLNIAVEIRTFEWAIYIDALDVCTHGGESLTECEFNAYRSGWIMDYGDPQNQLEVVFAPDSPFQFTGWQNERYEELMNLARTEFDQDNRAEYYKEADRILSEEEAVIIPIHNYDNASFLVKSGVTYEYPTFGLELFKHWDLP